ncbi:D-beta-hydroxybutyrate dehydrogenase, mitochondrial-like [Tubulanus polymorphus]|uniref:D-beta-hydroxybutyrate dehydrogenase, mitochondrial-like n=1 Tax=Tubulanus polymorphus TaxID=672921 RepID=UPI003DA41219
MASARILGVVLLMISGIIYVLNDDDKMMMFIGSMLFLLGVSCMVKYQPEHLPKTDKTVLITGCDTGFGHDIAIELDKLGCIVYAGCLFPEGKGATELSSTCSKRLRVMPLDVTSDESVKSAIECIKLNEPDGLWAVLNNAGVNYSGDAELTSISEYQKVSDVNLFGAIRVTNAAIPLIRKQQGRIVNVTSVKGRSAWPLQSAYCVSKWGLEAYSTCLRIEMKRWGIEVVIVEPGNYGATTGIHNMENVNKCMNTIWESMSQEQKLVYGRGYIDSQIKGSEPFLKIKAPTTQPVIDAYIEGLFSEEPEHHYLIGGGNHPIYDFCKASVYGSLYLPVWMNDWLAARWFMGIPLPQALRPTQ